MILYLFVLAVITWTDLTQKRIPDEWIVAGFILRFCMGESLHSGWLLAGIGFVLLVHAGLGWGDVKLAMLIYMSRGNMAKRAAISFATASCFSFLALALGRWTKKSQLPLAPFFIWTELFFL